MTQDDTPIEVDGIPLLTRDERRRHARGEPLDDYAIRLKKHQHNLRAQKTREHNRNSGGFVGRRRVLLQCGHVIESPKPHNKTRTCSQCERDGDARKRKPVAVEVDGQWVPFDEFRAGRTAYVENEQRQRSDAKVRNKAAHDSKEPKRVAVMVRAAVHGSDGQIMQLAQLAHATGLGALVVARLETEGHSYRAAQLRWLLDAADRGVVPDKAWYAQYGARAISQSMGGRPELEVYDLD